MQETLSFFMFLLQVKDKNEETTWADEGRKEYNTQILNEERKDTTKDEENKTPSLKIQ
jgi:hypothetical protein